MQFDAELLQPVVLWARKNRQAFRPNGFARQYGLLDEFSPPKEVWEIKRQIVEANNIQDAEQEPIFRDLCGFITEGGAVHPHVDCGDKGKQHVRFNVMVSKPQGGGNPVQNGVEILVQEGAVWRCDASLVMHSSMPVIGSKPRIVLSYGFLL